MNKEQKFWWYGKFFNNEKDFFKYAEKWLDEILTEEVFNNFLTRIRSDIWFNIQSLGLTNGVVNKILEDNFFQLMQMFYEAAGVKKHE